MNNDTSEQKREADIFADVFNPNETDLQYFQRRQRELAARPPKPVPIEAPGIGKVPVRN